MQIINSRRCIVTGRLCQKQDLLRVVRQKDGTFLVDSLTYGRGAYVLRSMVIWKELNQKRLLHRYFRTNVDQEVYEKIKTILEQEGAINGQ